MRCGEHGGLKVTLLDAGRVAEIHVIHSQGGQGREDSLQPLGPGYREDDVDVLSRFERANVGNHGAIRWRAARTIPQEGRARRAPDHRGEGRLLPVGSLGRFGSEADHAHGRAAQDP